MDCLIRYGRGPVQDFVTRSQSVTDAIDYIRAEEYLEIVRLTSFVTTNLTDFERKKVFP